MKQNAYKQKEFDENRVKEENKRGMVLKGKKGQGLPLNTVIVAILVVLVLVVVVAFFLGGFGNLANTVRSVFFGTTAGTDMSLAIENCRQYCFTSQTWENRLKASSPYCKSYFKLDKGGDGEADFCGDEENKYARFYCWGSTLDIACPGVKELCEYEGAKGKDSDANPDKKWCEIV
tara:strand:+ start:411 stop:938 length:528 start_codon:yes stop_codon:yes gene_type:complete